MTLGGYNYSCLQSRNSYQGPETTDSTLILILFVIIIIIIIIIITTTTIIITFPPPPEGVMLYYFYMLSPSNPYPTSEMVSVHFNDIWSRRLKTMGSFFKLFLHATSSRLCFKRSQGCHPSVRSWIVNHVYQV